MMETLPSKVESFVIISCRRRLVRQFRMIWNSIGHGIGQVLKLKTSFMLNAYLFKIIIIGVLSEKHFGRQLGIMRLLNFEKYDNRYISPQNVDLLAENAEEFDFLSSGMS